MECDKMQVPGWRIEKRFNTNVLIGNWSEERRKFQRGNNPFGNSTQRVGFPSHSKGSYIPDKKIRLEASMLNDGLPKKFIFSHYGDANNYSRNLISWYDQHMNQREIRESTLPKLREWDGKTTSFTPEKTDHPLQGNPTNFGLHEKMKAKWERQKDSVFESTNQRSYRPHEVSGLVGKHSACPKNLSSHFNKHNKVNNDLHFRNHRIKLAPEFLPPLDVKPQCPVEVR